MDADGRRPLGTISQTLSYSRLPAAYNERADINVLRSCWTMVAALLSAVGQVRRIIYVSMKYLMSQRERTTSPERRLRFGCGPAALRCLEMNSADVRERNANRKMDSAHLHLKTYLAHDSAILRSRVAFTHVELLVLIESFLRLVRPRICT
jgi:hypothetical protein